MLRDLADEAVRRLAAAGSTVAVAESCTGGWLGASLTSVPGSSAVFFGGIIAYDDEAKVRWLGVLPGTIDAHGAVSEPVAREMARGVRRVSGATIGIGITGVAGPGGGTQSHPVGTVYVALAGPVSRCVELHLEGDRDAVRRQSVVSALTMLAGEAAGDG